MPTDLIDLVNYQPSNKFFIATPENTDENFIIKGFVSVQIADRDKELVAPAAFDIPSYMSQPAVLVNHALWVNKMGNRVGVGVPISLHEVKLRTSDQSGMWSVWDVNAKKEIDVFPKDRNPNLGIGSRGLYTFMRITDSDVINMVKSGELSGFSWRGMSRPSYVYDDKTKSTYKSYSHIDLVEISLVTAPNNIGSSFIVAKDAIHSYQFDKTKYTQQDVAEQLTRDRMDGFTIVQNDSTIYAYDSTRVNEDGLLVVKMADGANLVLGKPQQSSATLTLTEDEKDTFLNTVAKSKETTMPDPVITPPVVVPDTTVVAKDATTPETPPVVVPPVVAQPVAFNMEEVVSKATDAIMAKVTPTLETLTGQVQALAQNFGEFVTKMTTPIVPVVPVVPPVLTTPEVPMIVQKQLAELAGVIEVVKKSVAGITPVVPARTEGTITPKPAHKNDCFNSLFGIKS